VWIVISYVIVLVISVMNRMSSGKTHVVKEKDEQPQQQYEIPKILYTFWDSPDNLPFLVKTCIESWKRHCPGYDVRVMNYENTKHIPIRHRDSHARYSDFVRLHCLSETGGVWLDASIFMNTNLETFIKQGFFNAYYLNDWTTNKNWPVIESWFIAAPKGCPFLLDWKNEFFRANEFENMGEYVDDLLVDKEVDPQDIHHIMLHYVAIHVAAQYCLQKKKTKYENMNFIRAETDAYMYLSKNDWNSSKAVDDLCTNVKPESNIIKFRGPERDEIQKKEDCVSKLSSQ
jgi:hypothetical protein